MDLKRHDLSRDDKAALDQITAARPLAIGT
jgi:hypothetical protein